MPLILAPCHFYRALVLITDRSIYLTFRVTIQHAIILVLGLLMLDVTLTRGHINGFLQLSVNTS